MKKALIHFLNLSVISLFFITNATAQDEFGSGYSRLSDTQHQANHCNGLNADITKEEKAFINACSKLQYSQNTCRDVLNECEGKKSSAKKNSKCLNQTISADEFKDQEEREDKIRDDVRSLRTSYQRAVREEITLDDDRLANEEFLKQAHKDHKTAGYTIFQNKISRIDALSEAVAVEYDKMDLLKLGLSTFFNDKVDECSVDAKAAKAEQVGKQQARARRGEKNNLSTGQLLNRSHTSVNAVGTLRSDAVLRNCTAFKTDKNKTTPFGRRYAEKKQEIAIQQRIVKRRIKALTKQLNNVNREVAQQFNIAKGTRDAAIGIYAREKIKLKRQVLASQQEQSSLLSSINERQVDLGNTAATTGTLAEKFLTAIGNLSSRPQKTRGANFTSKSKYDAFNDAQAALARIEIAERASIACNGSAEDRSFTNDAIVAIDEVLDGKKTSVTVNSTVIPQQTRKKPKRGQYSHPGMGQSYDAIKRRKPARTKRKPLSLPVTI